jgi:hypothetical protein
MSVIIFQTTQRRISEDGNILNIGFPEGVVFHAVNYIYTCCVMSVEHDLVIVFGFKNYHWYLWTLF